MATMDQCMVDLSGAIDATFDDDGHIDTNQREIDNHRLSGIIAHNEGRDESDQQEPAVAAEQEPDAIVEALTVVSAPDSSILSTEHFSDTLYITAPPPATTAKWYFEPDPENNYNIGTGDEKQTVARFKCHTESPLRMDSDVCVAAWKVGIPTYSEGIYEAIFGVSTQGFHHDEVESITFQLTGEEWCEGCQIIRGEELQRMCVPTGGIQRWKMHRSLAPNEIWDSYGLNWVIVRITIQKKNDASTVVDPGVFELHYMEFRLNNPEGYQDEASLIAHQPYLWSLDVRTIGPISEGSRQHIPTRIRSFGISGDGRYAATLASTNDDSIHLLTMWALPDMTDRRASANHDVSWDGSKIALGERDLHRSRMPSKIFSVYDYKQDVQHIKEESLPAASITMTTLQPSTAHQHCTGLKGFYSYGLFQLTNRQDSDIKNELFIACDEERVLVYRMHPQWNLLHTIPVSFNRGSWCELGQHNKYLAAMERSYGVISAWDIVRGSITSIANADANQGRGCVYDSATFSNDGKIMVVYTSSSGAAITSYWTATGTALGTYVSPHGPPNNVGIQFTKDDSRILVSLGCDHHEHIQAITWLILETTSMTVVDNILIPQSFNGYSPLVPGSDSTFYLSHGASLDLVPSYVQPRIACTAHCLENLTLLDDLTPLRNRLVPITMGQPTSFTAPSGLRYHFELQSPLTLNGDIYIIISIYDKDNVPSRTLRIPTFPEFKGIGVYFLTQTSLQLVDISFWNVTMWQLPLSFDDDLKLEVVRDFNGIQRWMICEHCELYSVEIHLNQEQEEAMLPYHINRHLGFKTAEEIFPLARLLHPSDPPIRKAILQYVCPHVNGCYDPEYPSDTLMATICRQYALRFDQASESFLQELLAFPGMRWIFRPDTSMESNPIWICLDRAKTESQYMLL
ncbi:hypothetical protein BGZ50_009711, partial [Haplosporangium sp. Z 11]